MLYHECGLKDMVHRSQDMGNLMLPLLTYASEILMELPSVEVHGTVVQLQELLQYYDSHQEP